MRHPAIETMINSKLNSGEYILWNKNLNSETKLKVWEIFDVVFDIKSETEPGYAQCKTCKQNLIYTNEKRGKNDLFNHRCMREAKEINNSISKPVASISKTKEVSTSKMNTFSTSKAKERLKMKAMERLQVGYVKFCAEDIRPFETYKDPGFISFAQKLVSFGALYGRTNIKEILRLKDISNSVTKLANCARDDIYSKVREILSDSYCSATTRMWTDYYKKVSYLSMTVHYIDKDWTMVNKVLFTLHFPEERKCGESIKNEIMKRFSKFNLEDELVRNITFITDEEPNIVEALQGHTRYNCLSHVINSILCQTFDEDFLEENAPEIQNLILKSKSLSIYLKENELEGKLKQPIHFHENEARWISKQLPMLKSILSQYGYIDGLMKEKKLDYFKYISKDTFQDLVSFLDPIKVASDALENKKSPTIHLVLLYRLKLCRHLEISDDDSMNLKVLKKRAKKILEEEYLVWPIHNMALFLCPNFRQLRMLNDIERGKVLENIHEEINCDCTKSAEVPVEPEEECSAPKRRKTSEFHEWEDITNHDNKSSRSVSCKEIKEYMNYQINEQINVLQFWKSHESTFPQLAKLAKKYLNIPASCVWSERTFGTEGTTLAQKSTTLKEGNVDDLLLLHSD